MTVSRIKQTARSQIEQIERTGTTEGISIKDRPIVLLTYRGARSGLLRKTPIMRVEFDGKYAAIASLGGAPTNPLWYQAVLNHRAVEVQDGADIKRCEAREVFGDERTIWWGRAVAAYPDYAEYQRQTDRTIPVLVLSPVEI